MTDVWESPGGGTTIKNGKGYEETWHTFTGSPEARKDAMIEYFGLDSVSVADLTPYEVSLHAEQIAHTTRLALSVLGGKPVAHKEGDSAEADTDAFAQARARRAQAEPAAPNPLLAAIEAQPDVAALKRLYAENKDAFADAELLKAYKAKGKALKAAV